MTPKQRYVWSAWSAAGNRSGCAQHVVLPNQFANQPAALCDDAEKVKGGKRRCSGMTEEICRWWTNRKVKVKVDAAEEEGRRERRERKLTNSKAMAGTRR